MKFQGLEISDFDFSAPIAAPRPRLVSAPGSRLARQMRPHLGAELWDEFVEHANRHYKAGWLRAFAPASGVLRCVGTLDGAPCPHAAAVDLRAGAGAGEGTGAGRGE